MCSRDLSIARPAGLAPGKPTQSLAAGLPAFALLSRFLVLAVFLAVELVAITVWVDGDELSHRPTLIRFVGIWGSWILRGIVGFAAIFVTFGYLKNKALVQKTFRPDCGYSRRVELRGTSWIRPGPSRRPNLRTEGVAQFSSRPRGRELANRWHRSDRLRRTRVDPNGDMERDGSFHRPPLAACVNSRGRSLSPNRYQPIGFGSPLDASHSGSSAACCDSFPTSIVSDPSTMVIGTSVFNVRIAPQCSGFEGAGLILVFGVVWLWLFRDECRFPQALLLLPAGVGLNFLLNAVRLASLIFIGNAGAAHIALGGFHSQAGWIAFNAVALGFSVAARHTPWIAVGTLTTGKWRTSHPAIPPLPIWCHSWPSSAPACSSARLLLILNGSTLYGSWRPRAARGFFGGSMPISIGGSDGTDQPYNPQVGVLVFGMWIALDRFSSGHAARRYAHSIKRRFGEHPRHMGHLSRNRLCCHGPNR